MGSLRIPPWNRWVGLAPSGSGAFVRHRSHHPTYIIVLARGHIGETPADLCLGSQRSLAELQTALTSHALHLDGSGLGVKSRAFKASAVTMT